MESFTFNAKFKAGDKVKLLRFGEVTEVAEVIASFSVPGVPLVKYILNNYLGYFEAHEFELFKEEPEFVWIKGYYVVPESNKAEVSCKLFYSHQEAEKFAKGKGFKKFIIRSQYVRTDKETSAIFKRLDFMLEKDLVK